MPKHQAMKVYRGRAGNAQRILQLTKYGGVWLFQAPAVLQPEDTVTQIKWDVRWLSSEPTDVMIWKTAPAWSVHCFIKCFARTVCIPFGLLDVQFPGVFLFTCILPHVSHPTSQTEYSLCKTF